MYFWSIKVFQSIESMYCWSNVVFKSREVWQKTTLFTWNFLCNLPLFVNCYFCFLNAAAVYYYFFLSNSLHCIILFVWSLLQQAYQQATCLFVSFVFFLSLTAQHLNYPRQCFWVFHHTKFLCLCLYLLWYV